MQIKPEIVVDRPCKTGEGPLWHPDENALYWTDIPSGRLYRYDLHSGGDEEIYRDRPVGGMTLQKDGSLLLFRDRGNVAVLNRGNITTIVDEIPELASTRFNDVIADPAGRVFAGTMSTGDTDNGMLYRFDCDGSFEIVSRGYGTPNGMGFRPDLRGMYFTDSRNRRIYLFDYDPDGGRISNRRVWVETSPREAEELGRSDGMTVDAEGFVWSARWDGGQILRYDPDGRIERRIPMPTQKISCPAFGGKDLDTLYITSAGGADRGPEDPQAGALFRLRGAGRGRPEFRSRIGCGT